MHKLSVCSGSQSPKAPCCMILFILKTSRMGKSIDRKEVGVSIPPPGKTGERGMGSNCRSVTKIFQN